MKTGEGKRRWFGAWRRGGPPDHANSPLIEAVEHLLADPARPNKGFNWRWTPDAHKP